MGGPTEDLLLAYRGTAYFLRWLAQLAERDYQKPGHPNALADRATTIATVGYDARGWANLVEALRERRANAATFAIGEREEAIASGSSLPPRALRYLVEHSAVHLAVEWRDLPAEAWGEHGIDDRNNALPVVCTPWLRARQTWLAAVDLGTGGSFSDFPPSMLDRLIVEEGGVISRHGNDSFVQWRGATFTGSSSSIARQILRGKTSPQNSPSSSVVH